MKLSSGFNVLSYKPLIDKLLLLQPVQRRKPKKHNPLGVFKPKDKAPQNTRAKLDTHQLNQIKYLLKLNLVKARIAKYYNVSP